MRLYELTYLLPLELKEDIQKISQEINAQIKENQGEIVKLENPILKKLAYPIKKQTSAFYGSIEFYFPPAKIKDLEKQIKTKPGILRFLLAKKEAPQKTPSPQDLSKESIPSLTISKKMEPEKKVELKDFDKKIDEILGE